MIKPIFEKLNKSLLNFSGDEETCKKHLEANLSDAKVFSDFIGLITRMTFCFFVATYALTSKNPQITESYFQIPMILTFYVLGAICYLHINKILISYFLLDISQTNLKKLKWLGIILGFTTANYMAFSIVWMIIVYANKN